jgi:hypothetical protein
MAKALFRVQDLQALALESRGNPAAQTFGISQSIASWLSGLKIIGQCVCYPRVLPIPTRRDTPLRHDCDLTTD